MRAIVLALSIFVMLGCAAKRSYGSFLHSGTPTTTIGQGNLAEDIAKELQEFYLPAKTCFELRHEARDVFGKELTRALRQSGYGILDFDPKTESAKTKKQASQILPLGYILEQADEGNLYRLTLMVDGVTLSRPYRLQTGLFSPVGYWARKE